MKKILIYIIFCTLSFSGYSRDNMDIDKWIKIAGSPGNSLFFGFEIAELSQRDFTDIGIENFTIHLGQRFNVNWPVDIGWSFLAYRATLSSKHISDPDQVWFIEGDRSVLSGKSAAANLWFDGSSNLLSLIKLNDRYLLRLLIEAGLGIGYGQTGFTNNNNGQVYDL